MNAPDFVEIDHEIIAAGLSIRTTFKTVFKDLPAVYNRYMDIKRKNPIQNLKSPWEYVSLSKNFDADKSWDYFTGHVITGSDGQNKGLVQFSVPPGLYAVFHIKCKTKLLLGFKMGSSKRYIYDQWLPKSGYDFAGYEYEYNNEEMWKESPYNIDLYVGIKKKDPQPQA